MSAELMKKIVGVPLAKSLSKDEKGFLTVRGYFTSDTRDEVGDIITRAATEKAVPTYRQWGNIRRMHAPDPVGRVLRIGAEEGLEWNEVEIMVIDPKAVFEVENGLLKALSVGILVNPDKVDMIRDGGWVINEYALAEISLVDHPANYDAQLFLSLNLDSRERMLVREFGVHGYLANKSNLEKNMEENTQPAVEETVETPVGEAEKDITAEQPVTEPVAEVPAEAAPVAEPVAEQVTEPVAVEASFEPAVEQPAVEEPVAETPVVVEASIDSQPESVNEISELKSLVVTLTASVATLTEAVAKMVPAQPATEEVTSEADSSVPQATDEAEVDVTKGLGAPANRESAVVPEPTPTEAPAATEDPAPVAKPKSLREAVKLFVDYRK